MPKLATTHSLNDYPRLPISVYRQQLNEASKKRKVTSFDMEYSYRGNQYRYTVKVTTTPCHYGGVRYWWLCPKCDKRVGVLYCAGLYVCRHCIGANYRIQHLQPIDKHFKRIAELRQRLGWQGGLAHGMGERPRYMHRRTFEKLEHEYVMTANKVLGMTLEQLQQNGVKVYEQ